MTIPEPHDFRKPAPLPSPLRVALNDWGPVVCARMARLWSAQLPFPVTAEAGEMGMLPATSVLNGIPDTTLRFRALQESTGAISILLVPRPLAIAVLSGLLGEEYKEEDVNRDLTSVEDDVVDLVAEQFFLEPLQLGWPLQQKLVLQRPHREPMRSSPAYLPTEPLLVARFRVRGPFAEPQEWCWMMPRRGWLDSLAGVREARRPSQDEREAIVRELPVEMTVILGNTRLSLLHLAALQPGDLLVLDQRIDQPLAVEMGGQTKFRVWAGARGSKQAVAIQTPVES